ncbi:hypothetical protein JTE90_001857 [Oedothorax gibbosus]|nr:hypothetical protein JTE90_001857 [Oedothorax gibbosus]
MNDQKVSLVDYSLSEDSEPQSSPDSTVAKGSIQDDKVPFSKLEHQPTTHSESPKKRYRTQAERIALDTKKMKLQTPCNSNNCKLNCSNTISLEELHNIFEEF